MLLAALILTACGSSGNNGENPVKASGVLRVGTEGVYSPFSYHDPATGQLVGYDVDVARAVADKLGVKVEFVETPWDAIFAALEANRFDVVANEVTISPERQQKYDLSKPYSVGEGVIVTRADDNSVKSLDDIKGKVAGETATSNWAQVARNHGARVESVEGFTQAIKLLNQGRVDLVINDSIAVYAYLAETGDTSVKIAGTTGEKSDQGLAARKNSGLLPDLNKALDELKDNGTLASISEKYLKANASGGPAAPAQDASESTWQLILRSLGPLAKAAITKTVPLTVISFVIGLVIALAVALARLSSNVILTNIARFYISIIRGTPLLVQLFIVFYALPELGVKIDVVPGGGHRVLPERRRLRRGDHPVGDPEHSERPVGGGRDDRPRLRRRTSAHHPSAGQPGCRAAAVEHVDLIGEGHLAGVDDPGHRATPASPDHRGAEVRILRLVRHRRSLLLGHLPGSLVRPRPH